MSEAPDWAWDLLFAVQEFEDVHPKADECLSGALEAVPNDVRIFAAGMREGTIRTLRRQLSSKETK